tara:strand:- start:240 stop:1070 length:831 start_codon:yes stop_codon:yes gene_type:complete
MTTIVDKEANTYDNIIKYLNALNEIVKNKFTLRDVINEANKQELNKYYPHLKTCEEVEALFGSDKNRDKGVCGKILEFALFGNLPNSDPSPDLGPSGDIKTNKWEKTKKGFFRSTERIKIGSAGNTDNWASFDHIINSHNIKQLKKYDKMCKGVIPIFERKKNACTTLEHALNLRLLYIARYDLESFGYDSILNEDLEKINRNLKNGVASQKGQKYLHLHTQGPGRGKNGLRALGYTSKFVTTLIAESIARDKKKDINSILISKGRSLYIDKSVLC